MTRIGRWPPCTTSRPLSFSCSRLPACANSLLGASMSIPPIVASGPLQARHNIGTLSRKARGFCGVGAARKHPSDTDLRCSSDAFTMSFLSTGHVKEPDPLCARPIEHLDRLGCRFQQDLAALSFEIGLSFR